MNKQEALEKFGLNSKEAVVYLKLLEIGNATASELSKKTNILRQTIYEVLENLKQKGLVSLFIQNKKKHFEAANPKKLEEDINEKQKLIKEILPELNFLKESIKQKPKVEFYEGIEGIKTIYNQILKDKPKELLEYGNSKTFIEIMKFYFIDNYIVKRIENKIKVKLITEKNEEMKKLYGTNLNKFRETRFLKEVNNLKTAGYIYNDKYIEIKFFPEPFGVVVEDPEIVKSRKIFFELIWGVAKK